MTMRRRFESHTRSGRIGDALLDLLYGAVVVASGLFLGAMSMVAVAEGTDDTGGYLMLGIAGLVMAAGLYFLVRAARGR
jgi:hypothetical protein